MPRVRSPIKGDLYRGSLLNFWCVRPGFTGTPIFAENKREALGNLARTTEELYGPILHKYTIKEAIHDGAVLGFQIQSMGKGKESLQEIALQNNLETQDKLADMSETDLEKLVLRRCEASNQDLYNNPTHREKVVDYILNRSSGKFNINAGAGNTFEAMLTCSSIKEAQAYYNDNVPGNSPIPLS